MEFRHSGQSNQRRRRVLKDDHAAAADEGAADGSSRKGRGASSLRHYSDHALAEHQLRVTDLIPQRAWTYTVLLLSGLFVIVATQTLFLHHSLAERIVGRNNLPALDPTRSGSVAGWISSMLLGLAAVFGLLVFSLRRHKIDDYRGRYRVWLPVAAILLAASLDASTGLHRAGRGLLEIVAKRYGDGSSLGSYPHFWWVSICLFGVTLVGIRLVIEMRFSRAAVTKLVLAFACYVSLACVEWNILAPGLGELTIVAASAARLLGDLCLCLSTATYARYVYLDAQGIIVARRLAREKKRRQAAAEKIARKEAAAAKKLAAIEAVKAAKLAKAEAAFAAAGESSAESTSTAASKPAAASAERSDKAAAAATAAAKPPVAKGEGHSEQRGPAPVAKSGPLAGRGSLPQTPPPDVDEDDDEDDDDGDSNLSRAERRRQKKLQRRDVRKAA